MPETATVTIKTIVHTRGAVTSTTECLRVIRLGKSVKSHTDRVTGNVDDPHMAERLRRIFTNATVEVHVYNKDRYCALHMAGEQYPVFRHTNKSGGRNWWEAVNETHLFGTGPKEATCLPHTYRQLARKGVLGHGQLDPDLESWTKLLFEKLIYS